IALDPIKTPLLGTTIKDTIKRGDADYVQVIHTSKKVGIWDQLGDIDVYVKYEPDTDSGAFNDDHLIAFFIHIATSTKRLFLTGELNETGIGNVSRTQPNTALTECTIGIYGSLLMKNRFKKFGISLENRNPVFWGGIGPFGKTEIFSGTQSETRENESSDSDDDDCSICYNNKVNARLSCDHEMCDTCWDTWQNTPSSKNKCPMCKQTVTSVDKI
ncbi:uncharacterized protein LOC116348192, partial [Contarinia nasturtii]|uniref:uncharacterized protein LOC116348192 n=1 Tax=Contarinia nasturtii TaxID=265458 RepID=UPI0012D3AA9B